MSNEVKDFAWPVTAISKENYAVIMECVKEHDELFSQKTIIIFGAGIRGAEIAVILKCEGYSNLLFTDNNSDKWDGVIDGIPIISVDKAFSKREEAVYLISVEEGRPVYSQLEKNGLIFGRDFFFPKPNLYQRFMDEFKRDMHNEILVMGDCMFEVIAFDDKKKDSLSEIMQQKLGCENVKHLTMHGMGLPTFYHVLRAQINNGMIPRILVVMLNFETLTGKQHLLPRSQHTELVNQVVAISDDPTGELKEYEKVVAERVKNVQAEFFTTNKFSSYKTANNKRGRISDNASKVFFKLNYLYKLNPEMESIQYLKKIMKLAHEKAFKLLPFVPPVNYERGTELFENRFEEDYNHNLNILKDIVDDGGFSLLDLSHICTKELFAHVTTPDETTNYLGRERIADYICKEIDKLEGR